MNNKATLLLTALLAIGTLGALSVAGCGKKDEAKTQAAPAKAEPPRPVRFMQVGMSALGDISSC